MGLDSREAPIVPPKPEMTSIGARIPKALADEMRALAAANDRSFSRELARALRAHIERHRGVGAP